MNVEHLLDNFMQGKNYNAILITAGDNVAVAIKDLKKSQKALIKGEAFIAEIKLSQDIPFGHKIAVLALQKEMNIIKYGEVIGKALLNIEKGEHVHVHNIVGIRGQRSSAVGKEPLR